MNSELDGRKYFVLDGNTLQTVTPLAGIALGLNMAALGILTGTARQSRYHCASFRGLRDLKNTPPTPSTLATVSPPSLPNTSAQHWS